MITEMLIDGITVRIFETRTLMGIAAAKAAAAIIQMLLLQKDEINIVFAAAPSQNEFLESLIKSKDIDWKRVNAFHMDEYIGLPITIPRRFADTYERN